MIHYHGTPITPDSVMGRLAGRCFCVSFATFRQGKDVPERAHELGQSVMLDNGAFTFWRSGLKIDWSDYVTWAERWLEYPSTWAVIPDVIDGTVEENDRLVDAWPLGVRGAPVWHLHEPVDRLLQLSYKWPRVCIGSSGEYAEIGDAKWHRRMEETMNRLCGNGPVPVWLHMLRGMSLSGAHYPFASVDSTDVGRNHHRARNDALEMALRWDGQQCPPRWAYRSQMSLLGEAA